MIILCTVLGIVVVIPDFILSLLWIIKFPAYVKKLSCSVTDISDNTEVCEISKGKRFFQHITKLFLINLCACIVSIVAFIVNILFRGGIPFYPAPLVILLCGGVVVSIVLDIFVKRIGGRSNIKVLNDFDKKLYPLGLASSAITSTCIFIGFFFAEVMACAVYMIQLLV